MNGTVAPISMAGSRINGTAAPRLAAISPRGEATLQPEARPSIPRKVHGKARPQAAIATSSQA